MTSPRDDGPTDADDRVSLTPFDLDRDLLLLRDWLAREHVRRWWGDPDKTLAEVMLPPLRGGEALIRWDARPVGYLRWDEPTRLELVDAGLEEIPPGAVDIEIAIGEVDALGQGVGTRALRLLIEQQLLPRNPPLIMLCVSADNHRALAAYAAAGFRRERRFDDLEYGPMWLLVLSTFPASTPAKA